MSTSPDWANLDGDLVDEILSKLFYLSDYIRFGTVCKPWHSVAVNQKPKRLETMHKQPPMVLNSKWFHPFYMSEEISQSITMDGEIGYQSSKLHSLTENRVYNHNFQVPCIPMSVGGNCRSIQYFGSSYGWLIMCNIRFKNVIDLYNPFTQKSIAIPCDSLDCGFLKIVLSCNPTTCPDDFDIAAICRKEDCITLALRKAGQEDSWCFTNILDFDYNGMADIIFLDGLLFILGGNERLIGIKYKNIINGDVDQSAPTRVVEIVPQSGPFGRFSFHAFLVETSSGNLSVVKKYMVDYSPVFQVFKIFKKNKKEIKSPYVWGTTSELENDTIFVCHDSNLPTFTWASSAPDTIRNSIFVSHKFRDRYHPSFYQLPRGIEGTSSAILYQLRRVRVFDMKDKVLRDLDYEFNEFNVTIWVTPTLC